MVTLSTGAQSLGTLTATLNSPQTSTDSTNSFSQQLAASLEAYLNQSSNGSPIEIDINPIQSQNSGVRQFTVTVKNLPAAASPAPVTAAATTPTPAAAHSAPVAPAASASGLSAGPDLSLFSADFLASNPEFAAGPQSYASTYWAAQPPAVQQLQNMPDFESRVALGQQLANQGYKIDPQIMIYGWNPYQVMKNRQDAGYTWVPSFSQASIDVPPGMSFPGLPTYDPFNPPAGSIRVTTDFTSAT